MDYILVAVALGCIPNYPKPLWNKIFYFKSSVILWVRSSGGSRGDGLCLFHNVWGFWEDSEARDGLTEGLQRHLRSRGRGGMLPCGPVGLPHNMVWIQEWWSPESRQKCVAFLWPSLGSHIALLLL